MSLAPTHKSRRATHLNRRRFMQTTAAAAGSQTVLAGPAIAPTATSLEAYGSATSVQAGNTLNIYARDPQAVGNGTTAYPLTIVRIGWPDVSVLSTTITLGNRVVPSDASANGCGWPVSYRLSVPKSWASGLYFAAIGSGPNACTMPFVVRAHNATAGAKVMALIPVTTVQAYNSYGGKSLYDYNSTDGIHAPKVSFQRPLTEAFNVAFDNWSQYLVRWLAKNGIAADFCTSHDLHADNKLLNPYQLYLSAGHDEYWTREMRDNLDAFVAKGGNAAILGGNTCWWQARLEGSNNQTLVCYKSAADPVSNPALKTVNWRDLQTPAPENTTIGLSFIKGASWTNGFARPVTPFVTQRAEHWAFTGTGLAGGSGFGGEFVGYETDAADFSTGTDGWFYPTGLDGTPVTLRILAQADGSDWDAKAQALGLSGELSGYAAIAVFSRGGRSGTVFNTGVCDWAYGLRPELDGQTPLAISRITLNVVQKLSKPWGESADVRQFHTVPANDIWHCSYTTGTQGPSNAILDGLAFRAYVAAESGTTVIYRFRSSSAGTNGYRYRLTTSPSLQAVGWVQDGAAFHAYAFANSENMPVYQFQARNAAGQDCYRYATSAIAPTGWNGNGVAFYAPKV